MSEKLEGIIESIAGLTVLELSELVKALEEKFGVTAAAPMAMAMPMMAGAAEAAKDEGPTSFNVVLKEFGSQKINVIKKVKDIAGLGLKEAKDLVDACPKAVKEGIPEDEANKIKEDLESVGAVVEVVGVA
jgi:large subunit ribosomal protein L7/L12